MPQFDLLTLGAQLFGLLISLYFFYYYFISTSISNFIEIKKLRTKKVNQNTESLVLVDKELNHSFVYISIFFYFIAVIGTITVSTACLVLLGGCCEPGFISVKQELFSFSFNSVVITPIIDPEGLLIFLLFILFSNFLSSLVKYLVELKREASERKKLTVGDLRILVCESTEWGDVDICLTYLSYIKKRRSNFRNLIEEVLAFRIFAESFSLNEQQEAEVKNHLYKHGFKDITIKTVYFQLFTEDSAYVLNIEFEAKTSSRLRKPRDLLVYHGGALIAVDHSLKKEFPTLKKEDYGFIGDINAFPKQQMKEYLIKKNSYDKYLNNTVADVVKYDIKRNSWFFF